MYSNRNVAGTMYGTDVFGSPPHAKTQWVIPFSLVNSHGEKVFSKRRDSSVNGYNRLKQPVTQLSGAEPIYFLSSCSVQLLSNRHDRKP